MFLLDTNVISHMQKESPNPKVRAWLEGQDQYAIPFSAIVEIQQGIHLIGSRDPSKGSRLQEWLDGILDSDFVYPTVTDEVARTIATLNCCGPLKTLWGLTSKRRLPGQDPMIAATAIVYGLPIATLDSADFLMIDRYFRLPASIILAHSGYSRDQICSKNWAQPSMR